MTESFSVLVPNTSTESTSCVRRTHKSDLIGKTSLNGSLTLYETFWSSVRRHSGRPCLGERPVDSNDTAGLYLFHSYAETGVSVRKFASGLVKEQLLSPNDVGHKMLGIFLKNSSYWVVAEQACYYLSAVTVPLYESTSIETLEFILNQTHLETVVCSERQLKALVEVAPLCPWLKAVIVNSPALLASHVELAKSANLNIVTVYDIERIGEAFPVSPQPPEPDSLATLCYTSGTTGKPKGAIITHRNIIAVSASGLESCMHIKPEDCYLSFLPLPHIFERLVINSLLASGAAVGFYRGDPLKIVEDLVALRPTVFCAVPRLLNRIYDKIMQGVSSAAAGLKGSMLRAGVRDKLANYRKSRMVSHRVWDQLVFRKIKAALGLERVRLLLSGGAPLPIATMEFFRILLGADCTCHEGYGQTETTGGTTVTFDDDFSVGHVGGPFPCCEIRLADVPDMGYLHTDTTHADGTPCDGRGEIWVRGPGVIQGYYQNPEETKAAGLIPGERGSWLRTGDVGMWLPHGQLAVIDRKKNLFKLSQGEYIAVEKVEGVLGQCSLVSQIFVHGEPTKDKLIAIVVPDNEAVSRWRFESRNNADFPDSSCAVDSAEVCGLLRAAVVQQLLETGRRLGLAGFELVYAVYLEMEAPWTPENDLLTPTMKLKRNELRKKYAKQLGDLYNDLNAAESIGPARRSRL